MSRLFGTCAGILLFVLAAGCNKAARDDNGIRAAVQKHLAANSSLNMAAMDMYVKQVAVNGDRAQAQVEFRLKQGGASMHVVYALERKDDGWTVAHSQPTGGEIAHPPMDQSTPPMPADATPSVDSVLNNFRTSGSSPGAKTAPADHPPVEGPGRTPKKNLSGTPRKTE